MANYMAEHECELEIQSSNERHVTPLLYETTYCLQLIQYKLLHFYIININVLSLFITITSNNIFKSRYLHECNQKNKNFYLYIQI